MPPQTAAQINGPQVGSVELPDHEKLIANLKAAEQEAQKGWWSLRGLSGSLAGVTKAVIDSKIPDHWKKAIVADMEGVAECGFNFVYLDAHYHLHEGQGSLHLTIRPDKKLL